jgi:hypothetical protein
VVERDEESKKQGEGGKGEIRMARGFFFMFCDRLRAAGGTWRDWV